MSDVRITRNIKRLPRFSRREYVSEMKSAYGMTESQVKYDLEKRLDRGEIIRVGWDVYSMGTTGMTYDHEYSDKAMEVVKVMEENFYEADFQVFEIIQLNQFVNHLLAHNTIMLYVEKDLMDYSFDLLRDKYPGRVLLKPSIDTYYRYLQDDEIIIQRLPTDTPKGIEKPWKARIEKILVDLFTDKLVSEIVPEGEKEAIIEGAYANYLIDENTMLRYAKRKGAEKKVVSAMNEYGRMTKA